MTITKTLKLETLSFFASAIKKIVLLYFVEYKCNQRMESCNRLAINILPPPFVVK